MDSVEPRGNGIACTVPDRRPHESLKRSFRSPHVRCLGNRRSHEPVFLYVDEPSDSIDDSQQSLSSVSVRLYTPGASRVRMAWSLRTDVAESRALTAAARLH